MQEVILSFWAENDCPSVTRVVGQGSLACFFGTRGKLAALGKAYQFTGLLDCDSQGCVSARQGCESRRHTPDGGRKSTAVEWVSSIISQIFNYHTVYPCSEMFSRVCVCV